MGHTEQHGDRKRPAYKRVGAKLLGVGTLNGAMTIADGDEISGKNLGSCAIAVGDDIDEVPRREARARRRCCSSEHTNDDGNLHHGIKLRARFE